jgi:uncharacterized protein DUF3606
VQNKKTPERPRTRNRINVDDKYELEYWSKTLGISQEELRSIVARVGNAVETVALEIEKRKAA